ncbi:hypothetical protein Cfor_01449 [Coptotermes formosanus]|uniref:Uncharacterized protein n=1 Tax=Coptotermes formosanus TaxID=36987 RepID=A0A6L2Q8B9_COPFO|nr:hypothetical protein Cfor_01449 [Coptotermes formosanus]
MLNQISVPVSRRTSPSKQNIRYTVNELKTTGLLLDKNPNRKRNVLTAEKLDSTGASLETSPRNSLKRLDQETSVPKTSAQIC